MSKLLWGIFPLFFLSCSDLELSEKERVRREQAKGEFIERKKEDRAYPYKEPTLQKREAYPWEIKKSSS